MNKVLLIDIIDIKNGNVMEDYIEYHKKAVSNFLSLSDTPLKNMIISALENNDVLGGVNLKNAMEWSYNLIAYIVNCTNIIRWGSTIDNGKDFVDFIFKNYSYKGEMSPLDDMLGEDIFYYFKGEILTKLYDAHKNAEIRSSSQTSISKKDMAEEYGIIKTKVGDDVYQSSTQLLLLFAKYLTLLEDVRNSIQLYESFIEELPEYVDNLYITFNMDMCNDSGILLYCKTDSLHNILLTDLFINYEANTLLFIYLHRLFITLSNQTKSNWTSYLPYSTIKIIDGQKSLVCSKGLGDSMPDTLYQMHVFIVMDDKPTSYLQSIGNIVFLDARPCTTIPNIIVINLLNEFKYLTFLKGFYPQNVFYEDTYEASTIPTMLTQFTLYNLEAAKKMKMCYRYPIRQSIDNYIQHKREVAEGVGGDALRNANLLTDKEVLLSFFQRQCSDYLHNNAYAIYKDILLQNYLDGITATEKEIRRKYVANAIANRTIKIPCSMMKTLDKYPRAKDDSDFVANFYEIVNSLCNY